MLNAVAFFLFILFFCVIGAPAAMSKFETLNFKVFYIVRHRGAQSLHQSSFSVVFPFLFPFPVHSALSQATTFKWSFFGFGTYKNDKSNSNQMFP